MSEQTLEDLRDNVLRNMDDGQRNGFVRACGVHLWNLAIRHAANIAESEPRVWDTNAPDPQTRIAAKILQCKLEEPLPPPPRGE